MSACPRCQHPLVHGAHGGWTAWGCQHCGGVWLDIVTARSLVAPLTDLGISTDPSAARLPCPVCRSVMGPRYSPTAGVEIDECPAHGAWFDHQELVRVSETVSRLHGSAPSPAQDRFAKWGPPAAVGIAAGVAAVGVASGLASDNDPHRNQSSLADAPDAVVEGADVSFTLAEGAGEVAGDAGSALVDAGASTAELAGDAAEGAFSVLEGVFAVIGGIFEGL